MNKIMAMSSIEGIQASVAPLRAQLTAHPLYSSIRTVAHLRIFMESHVFAVWDFMSLLKALQVQLTCITLPWLPTCWPESRRFINTIVLGEESDVYQGRSVSHFELYLEAMHECDANTAPISDLLKQIASSPGDMTDESASTPLAARQFVGTTFKLIREGSLQALAAAFTFGHEDVIPDLFRRLVDDMDSQLSGRLKKFIWYLERHVELDGDDHGPLSRCMLTDLCGADQKLWDEAATAAESAILARLDLWDRILAQIQEN
jgi:hypothetical protein